MTTIENRLKDFKVRIVDSEMQFVEKNDTQLETLLFLNGPTESLFKIYVAKGLKELEIRSKERDFINFTNEGLRFLFAYKNWLLLADMSKKRLYLYKIV